MFDNIRPLTDAELPQALDAIAASPLMTPIARFIHPGADPEDFARQLRSVADIHTLQDTVMRDAIGRIV